MVKIANIIVIFSLFFFISCSTTLNKDEIKVSPQKLESDLKYNLIVVRYNGVFETYKEIEQNNVQVDPILIAKESFIKSWNDKLIKANNNLKNNNLPMMVFVTPEEIGLVNTILNINQKSEEALTREDPIKLTQPCLEKLKEFDIQGVFWIDIKRIALELNNKAKQGRIVNILWYSTYYSCCCWWFYLVTLRDYQLTTSVEYGYFR